MYECVSTSFIGERATASTLPFAIDDPSETASLSDIIVTLFNKGQIGKSRSKRESKKLPIAAPIISTNYPLKKEPR